MLRAARFIIILVAGLGLLTWAALVLVTNTTRAWFDKDVVLRSQLVLNGAHHLRGYVGDDETDEDVFSLEDPGLLGIRVGQVDSSRASFCIRDQGDIDELLQALIAFRPAADGQVRAGA
jgi:hypothetical protein